MKAVVVWLGKHWLSVIVMLLLAGGGVAAAATQAQWLPGVRQWLAASAGKATTGDGHDDHHGHDHAGHEDGESIKLSPQALKNIGFEPQLVKLGTFERTITIPAIVVERPGQSRIQIAAPLTGVVTGIHVIEGEAIEPGTPLFDIRLTHEELVTSQRDFLRSAEELDVVKREIERLESLPEGVIAGKRILDQQYERQKIEAAIKAQREGLLLHGLTDQQVDDILTTRKLLGGLTVYAPAHNVRHDSCSQDHLFHVQRIAVHRGQQVEAGQTVAELADHCELHIEGKAFEDDAERLREAADKGWSITARLLSGDSDREQIKGLQIYYPSDRVEPESRAFHFYIQLPNEIVSKQTRAKSLFIQWRYKPGQRMELRVPLERWENRIVLPIEAVVDEGAEKYVYQQNGDHFDRVPVHVEYSDQQYAVVANDGSIFPGDVVAGRGAYQMHLALKNKMGGGVDPHAGHHH